MTMAMAIAMVIHLEEQRWLRCNNTGHCIRACESSSLAARFEVLVSPERPCTIITADPSFPSRSAAVLNICHDYIHTSGGTLRKRQGAQLAGHQQMRTMNNAHTLTFI